VPVPRAERLPDFIVEGLNALNERWAREEPLLHQLLASACLAPILVDGAPAPTTIDVTPTRVTTKRKARAPIPGQVVLFSETVQ
jgi:outer membrane receptor protein involved in Fe transport